MTIKGSRHSPVIGFLFYLAAIPFAVNVRILLKLLRGRIFLELTRSINIRGGVLSFKEPSSPYEIWLFMKVPFARYNGSISVANGTNRIYSKDVPRRSSILLRLFRSGCASILLCPPYDRKDVASECNITLHLQPTLKSAPLNIIFEADDVVPMTLLVKSN